MKDTLYSKEFFRKWWDDSNRSLAHDQIYFDILYKSLTPSIRNDKHVLILPTRFINSVPPAIINMEDSDKFLHLMGERNDLRKEVFSFALNQLCNAVVNNNIIPHQLGLSPSFVLEISNNIYNNASLQLKNEIYLLVKEIKYKYENFQSKDECISLELFDRYFDKLGELREVLLQLGLINDHIIESDRNKQIDELMKLILLSISENSLLFEQIIDEQYRCHTQNGI